MDSINLQQIGLVGLIGVLIMAAIRLWGQRLIDWVGGHFSRHEQLMSDVLADNEEYERTFLSMIQENTKQMGELQNSWLEQMREWQGWMRDAQGENHKLRAALRDRCIAQTACTNQGDV